MKSFKLCVIDCLLQSCKKLIQTSLTSWLWTDPQLLLHLKQKEKRRRKKIQPWYLDDFFPNHWLSYIDSVFNNAFFLNNWLSYMDSNLTISFTILCRLCKSWTQMITLIIWGSRIAIPLTIGLISFIRWCNFFETSGCGLKLSTLYLIGKSLLL